MRFYRLLFLFWVYLYVSYTKKTTGFPFVLFWQWFTQDYFILTIQGLFIVSFRRKKAQVLLLLALLNGFDGKSEKAPTLKCIFQIRPFDGIQ